MDLKDKEILDIVRVEVLCNAIREKILELAEAGIMYDDEPQDTLDPDDTDILGVGKWYLKDDMVYAQIIHGTDYDEFHDKREYHCPSKYLLMDKQEYLKENAALLARLKREKEDPEFVDYQRLKAKYENCSTCERDARFRMFKCEYDTPDKGAICGHWKPKRK